MHVSSFKLWITFDFGASWLNLGKIAKVAPEWEQSNDELLGSIYFIENEERKLVKINLDKLSAGANAADEPRKVIKTNVLNFELADKTFLFTTSLIVIRFDKKIIHHL